MPNNLPNKLIIPQSLRLKEVKKRQKEELQNLRKAEKYIKTALDNKLCKNQSIRVSSWISSNSMNLIFNDVDIPTVIDHVCGPIHRKFDCDWQMEVHYNSISLTAKVYPKELKGKKKEWWHDSLYSFLIRVYEGEMQTCEIVEVEVRELTDDEYKNNVREAERLLMKRSVTERKILCA